MWARRKTWLTAIALCLALTAGAARAADWEIDLDARLVTSDGRKSFLDGGLGALRYGEDQSGVHLGRARLALSQPFGEVWTVHLDASSWGDDDRNPFDLTEAYLQFRPYPLAGYRFRLKAGAFHAPISLENPASGWGSPYTLSHSAINSWLGEELRTIGLEGELDWLGTRLGHAWDLGATGGVFGWNDPAGALLASHGFALDDRQTTLFGRVGEPGVAPVKGRSLFYEIDHQPGFYAGVEARYLDRIVLRALRYDNRGDPEAHSPRLNAYAWQTRFNAAGVRLEGPAGWTVIAQWLDGETYIEPFNLDLEWPFTARFVLLSKQIGAHRLSVRHDEFSVRSDTPDGAGAQDGRAWTLAYVFTPDEHWRVAVEWLRVSSTESNRAIFLHESPFARETQLQLSVRYALAGTL